MIRCTHEVLEKAHDTKARERVFGAPDAAPVMGFDDLLRREGHLWRNASTPSALRAVSARVRDRLCHDDFRAFVRHIEHLHGTAVARRAGLPVGRPKLVLAS